MIVQREYNIYKIYASETSRKPYIYNADTERFYFTTGRECYWHEIKECYKPLVCLIEDKKCREIVNRLISYPIENEIKENFFLLLYHWLTNFKFDDREIVNVDHLWKHLLPLLKTKDSLTNIDSSVFWYNLYIPNTKEFISKRFPQSEKLIEDWLIHYIPVSCLADIEKCIQVKAWRKEFYALINLYIDATQEFDTLKQNNRPLATLLEYQNIGYTEHYISHSAQEMLKKLIHDMLTIFDFLKRLDLEDSFTVTNIKADLEMLKLQYDKHRLEADNCYFKKNQTSKNLFFENDKYKVIIPTSREELYEIGTYFHNCANRQEWDMNLCNGRRYLVVVVEKKTDKMRVCCDIDSKTLKIAQYLTVNNRRDIPQSAENFKTQYQEYLKTLLS